MEDPTPKKPLSETTASRAAEALRELNAHAQTVASTRRERLSLLEAELTDRLDAIASAIADQSGEDEHDTANADPSQEETAALRELLEQQQRELDERAEQLAQLEQSLSSRDAALEEESAALAQREEALAKYVVDLDEREQALTTAVASQQAEWEAAEREAAESETAWQTQRAELERERDEKAAQLADLQSQLSDLQTENESSEQRFAEGQARLEELKRQLTDQHAAAELQITEWDEARAELERERDGLRAELTAAQADSDVRTENAAAVAERDELKNKFSLALEDVQRFRTRVAALEQELAQRPAAGQSDSAELVSLRAERDALAERIETLEQSSSLPTSDADDQQRGDLQRRFELAVEDVRELKTKNSRLEAQLAAARQQSTGAVDAGGMDWESQKRRMLASLEDSGDGGDEESERRRTTIASTIEITDAVIAEKDQEISELKSQLAACAETSDAPSDDRDQAVNALLDADEIIQQHRQKIAQLEQEMNDKLRAAELEISVERAKIARQKVELDQLQAKLEAERNALGVGAGQATTAGAPKRRWLSKLGLGSEEGE
jgi:DNA repair exonuclease SbcCD ATPase subunit